MVAVPSIVVVHSSTMVGLLQITMDYYCRLPWTITVDYHGLLQYYCRLPWATTMDYYHINLFHSWGNYFQGTDYNTDLHLVNLQ